CGVGGVEFVAGARAADRLEAQAPIPAPLPRQPPGAKPAETKPADAKPPAWPPASGQPARGGREPDLAYGAFQRGYFLTAFGEATRRVNEKQDPRAMTLLGEIYSNGFGVALDEVH